jgi:phosphate transport system protein
MSIKKESAIHNIIGHFEDYANLILSQLSILEKIVNSGSLTIPEDLLKELNMNEDRSDNFEIKLSEKIVNTIVLQKPVASDLRKLMACYQIVINLERIGDLVMDIVKFIPRIKDAETYNRMSEVIYNMLLVSVNMVQKAILSFINSDKEFAIWAIRNDEVVDEMNHKLIRKAITKSKLPDETQQLLFSFIHINSIISSIERIADHATNVAEASIYAMEGTDIRHHHPDNEVSEQD